MHLLTSSVHWIIENYNMIQLRHIDFFFFNLFTFIYEGQSDTCCHSLRPVDSGVNKMEKKKRNKNIGKQNAPIAVYIFYIDIESYIDKQVCLCMNNHGIDKAKSNVKYMHYTHTLFCVHNIRISR